MEWSDQNRASHHICGMSSQPSYHIILYHVISLLLIIRFRSISLSWVFLGPYQVCFSKRCMLWNYESYERPWVSQHILLIYLYTVSYTVYCILYTVYCTPKKQPINCLRTKCGPHDYFRYYRKALAYVENVPQVTEQSFLAKRTCPHVVSSLQPSDVLSSFGKLQPLHHSCLLKNTVLMALTAYELLLGKNMFYLPTRSFLFFKDHGDRGLCWSWDRHMDRESWLPSCGCSQS